MCCGLIQLLIQSVLVGDITKAIISSALVGDITKRDRCIVVPCSKDSASLAGDFMYVCKISEGSERERERERETEGEEKRKREREREREGGGQDNFWDTESDFVLTILALTLI